MLAPQPPYREPERFRNHSAKPPPPESASTKSSAPRNFPEPPLVLLDRKGGAQYSRGGLLGEGGFARCYEAIDATGGRFAVKVIPKASLKTSKQKQKLIAEIRIHQLMSHPNIVGFKHVFEDDDFVYMILELCENKTFVEMLKKRRRLTEPEVRHYMWQLLDAVSDIHRRGVIHRDLKLGNFFLTRDMHLKLGDFGLAAMIKHDGERKKTICGTPNYIAPEVLFDTQTGHSFEVDIWSLGVVMYTFLIGRPPFQTKDVKAIYRKIRDNAYDFPSQAPISELARSMIESLLQSRPECRPSVNDIMKHDFFSVQPVLRTIPVSALTTVPDFAVDFSPAPSRRLPLHETASVGEARYNSTRRPISGGSGNGRSPNSAPGSSPNSEVKRKDSSGQTDLNLVKDFDRLKLDSENRPPIPTSWMRRQQSSDSSRGSNKSGGSSGRTSEVRGAPMPTPDPDETEHHSAGSRSNPDNSSPTKHRVEPCAPPSPNSEDIPNPLKLATFEKQVASSQRQSSSDYISPKPADKPRKTVNIMERMFKNLHDALSNPRDAAVNLPAVNAEEVETPRIFITKWIDYSNRYGMGYQLRDGSVGVYFNDSTSIILAADNHHFEYLYYDRGSERSVMHRKPHTITQYPGELHKKVTLLKHFRGYMQDCLYKIRKPDWPDAPKTQNLEFLTKYLRTKHGVFFRLSNQVVQLNLFDHSKVIVSHDGLVVTFIDQNRQFTTKTLVQFVRTGNKDIIDRLKYVREVLHHMLLKKQRKISDGAAFQSGDNVVGSREKSI